MPALPTNLLPQMKFLTLLITGLIGFSACKNQQKPATDGAIVPEQTLQSTAGLPQDFVDFYDKFHQDSLFQMEHIVWPLQGDKSVQVDSFRYEKKNIQWQQADWRMQRIDYNPNDYLRELQTLGDMMIIERIMTKSANYGVERRFAKQPDGSWALIFYSDMQERGN